MHFILVHLAQLMNVILYIRACENVLIFLSILFISFFNFSIFHISKINRENEWVIAQENLIFAYGKSAMLQGRLFFRYLDRILFLVTKSVISSSFLCMGSMVCDRLGQKSFLI